MEKKSKKDTDLDVLSTKLDCLNNRLNRMQNDYDSTLADLMISVREKEIAKEVEKEVVKQSKDDVDVELCKCGSFGFKCLLIFSVIAFTLLVLGEVIKPIVSLFL